MSGIIPRMHTEHKQNLEAEKAKLEAEMVTLGQRNPRVENDWETARE